MRAFGVQGSKFTGISGPQASRATVGGWAASNDVNNIQDDVWRFQRKVQTYLPSVSCCWSTELLPRSASVVTLNHPTLRHVRYTRPSDLGAWPLRALPATKRVLTGHVDLTAATTIRSDGRGARATRQEKCIPRPGGWSDGVARPLNELSFPAASLRSWHWTQLLLLAGSPIACLSALPYRSRSCSSILRFTDCASARFQKHPRSGEPL